MLRIFACVFVLALVTAPAAGAVGDWSYDSSSSSGYELQLAWGVSTGNPPQYEVFTLPVAFDPDSVWCATPDGHDAAVTVGQPDGNPNQFECNFGPDNRTQTGNAGVTTTTPMPCNGTIQQKFSWDGSAFFPEDDLTFAAPLGSGTPPGCSGSGGSGGSGQPSASPPSVSTSGKSSTTAQGTSIVVNPGIRETCPVGGAACSASETATARVATTARAKTKKVLLGQASFTIPAGATSGLTFKLSRPGAKLLRKLKTLNVTVTVVSRVAGSQPTTTTKQITIRVPATKHH